MRYKNIFSIVLVLLVVTALIIISIKQDLETFEKWEPSPNYELNNSIVTGTSITYDFNFIPINLSELNLSGIGE